MLSMSVDSNQEDLEKMVGARLDRIATISFIGILAMIIVVPSVLNVIAEYPIGIFDLLFGLPIPEDSISLEFPVLAMIITMLGFFYWFISMTGLLFRSFSKARRRYLALTSANLVLGGGLLMALGSEGLKEGF